ncbi:hypothetical protein FIBSPDRAFT_944618 [Athelia psychrophila]|uniref:Uncharacterized protein n=1 Tax=Athelia psychrophila TaxID=1759441 RepID=A0A166UU54_9AGAM|nr:hypothetical protein FIBSPDRAFT_944618 [Fibularhizoctonia sp. CBS 109695]
MGDTNIPLRDITPTDDCIIIMGVTGAGKSTFVAHSAGGNALDNDEHIGHGLLSRTDAVNATRVTNRDTGRSVVLLDTPGFDDTNNPDIMVLETIADWLIASGRTDIRLAGVIYLHRISDNRMNKSKLNNLTMLQYFVGAKAMPNIALITTLWSGTSQSAAENRETELCSTFWEEMLNNGATYYRFEDTTDSAWDVITPLLAAEPLELLFQKELRTGIPIAKTQAGSSVTQKLQRILTNVLTDLLRVLFRWQ